MQVGPEHEQRQRQQHPALETAVVAREQPGEQAEAEHRERLRPHEHELADARERDDEQEERRPDRSAAAPQAAAQAEPEPRRQQRHVQCDEPGGAGDPPDAVEDEVGAPLLVGPARREP